jgi:restriction system protein
MSKPRSRGAPHEWLFRLQAKSLLVLSAACFVLLDSVLPYGMRDYHALAPFARLARAAAPLVAFLLLVPLPGALWRAWRERRLVRKLRSIDALRAMNWREFEILMRRVFERQGFRAERVGGDGADGGVDIILRKGHLVVLVQCKQWKTRQVAVGVVRELLGVIALEGADAGVVVTCGVFTRDAREFAQRANITLLDGMAVLGLAEGVQLATLGRVRRPHTARQAAQAEDSCACPSCGGQMVRRQAKAGPQRGSHFLGCANFPDCKGTRKL